jgi:hypothetical protein
MLKIGKFTMSVENDSEKLVATALVALEEASDAASVVDAISATGGEIGSQLVPEVGDRWNIAKRNVTSALNRLSYVDGERAEAILEGARECSSGSLSEFLRGIQLG